MTIAVVGTGSIARRHIGNLLRLGRRDLVVVSEFRKLPGLVVDGTDLPVVHAFDDALPAAEGVVIANPSVFHLDYARRTVVAGKHLFLEKPVSISPLGVPELIKEVQRRGVTVAVSYQYRFDLMLNRMLSRLRAGDCGLLLKVSATLGEHIADYHPEEDYRLGYAARADLGGGVLLTQIHLINFLNWLFGPFTTVYAISGKRSDLEIDVDDAATFLLRSQSGTPVIGHLDYLQRPKRVALSVTGTKGRFDWDYFAGSLSFTAAAAGALPSTETVPFDRPASFVRMMEDFLLCMRSGARPRSTLEDGLVDLQIVDAIRRSSRTDATLRIAGDNLS